MCILLVVEVGVLPWRAGPLKLRSPLLFVWLGPSSLPFLEPPPGRMTSSILALECFHGITGSPTAFFWVCFIVKHYPIVNWWSAGHSSHPGTQLRRSGRSRSEDDDGVWISATIDLVISSRTMDRISRTTDKIMVSVYLVHYIFPASFIKCSSDYTWMHFLKSKLICWMIQDPLPQAISKKREKLCSMKQLPT